MIHSRNSVLRAIEECDRLGRSKFLSRYGYKPAKSYLLVQDGRLYDSKAIVGVAYGYENPEHGPKKSSDFVGGKSTVQRWLTNLGFEVVQSASDVSDRTATPARTDYRQTPGNGGAAGSFKRLLKAFSTSIEGFLGGKPPRPKRRRARSGPKTVSRNRNAPVDAAQVGGVCQKLHSLLNDLPRFGFPIPLNQIPSNGIYVLFEEGESGHGRDRIVRIGTHTGDGQLPSRLQQHFLSSNKDRSIFRKNIGRCFLNRDGDPFLADWELDLTTRAAKEAHAARIGSRKQQAVEDRVSAYMRSRFRFAVFEVTDKEERLWLESRIIATVSHCDRCSPSKKWLGLDSPKHQIRESGLWLVNELWKTPFSPEELERLVDRLKA